MNPDRVSRLRRALVGLALFSGLWAAAIAVTGGFVVHVFGLPITSRNPRNPLLIFLATSLAAWALPMPDRRRTITEAWRRSVERARSLHRDTPWLRWADPAALVALAGVALELYLWAGARPLWLDEQMLAINLRDRSLAELAGPLWLGQGAPFGWLALQRSALLAFGDSEPVLRLVPVLFGCGLLAAAVWIGRQTMSAWGAGLFVLLCALGQWLSHYPFELKHYSADAFWGLLLPALTVWAIDAEDERARKRRVALWWAAALVGHWLAYGALLATPACALILLAAEWRRGGRRSALRFSMMGAAWLLSFGLHFRLSLANTATSAYLRDYWSMGFPPASAGALESLRWLASRLEPLAMNPAGTEWWLPLWLSALGGFVFAGRTLGIVAAAMPLSAFALGMLRAVPLHDRLALWIVPSLYLGVALFAEAGIRLLRTPSLGRRTLRVAMAAAVASLLVPVCADITGRGAHAYRTGRWPDSNHGLDDRAAVRWLMDQRRPGDAVVTTNLGVPAIWWYGGVPVSGPAEGNALPDGTPIVEVALESRSECPEDQVRELIEGRGRLLVYAGFPDQPAGPLLARLGDLGVVTAERRFAESSRAVVIELNAPADIARAAFSPGDGAAASARPCLEGKFARRW